MKSIKINFFLAVCLISQIAFAQNPSGNSKFYNIDVKSPGVTSFIKYGNMSSLSYTGALDYDIPLFSIPMNGFNPINISLKYDSSGFRPAKRSGLVGLNWFLNMGGAITRDVNGMPDDQMGEPNSNGARKETNGFIVGIRNTTHNSNNVFGFSSEGYESMNLDYYLYGSDIYNNYEGDPDTFNFNFNGISGKFFMGNDGIIKVITNEPNGLKIDISGMQNQLIVNNGSKPKESLIIITDNEGNKYYFGGNTKNLEYSANNNYPIITTWHLFKIEYYNGRLTNFIFRDDSGLSQNFDSPGDNVAIHNGFPAYSGNANSLKDFCVLHEYISDERELYSYGNDSNSGSGGVSMSTTLQKIAILNQIVDDNYIIDFKYSRQAHIFNTRNSGTDIFINTSFYKDFIDIKLDEIDLYSKNGALTGDLVKKVNFGYTYLGGNIHSRMFLTSLTESGKPPYLLEYYDTNNLPKPITFGIDHWSFWNGNNDNSNQLIPYQNYQTNGDYSDCTNTGNSSCVPRNPNFQFTLKGMLKKVVYPTSGYTRFVYEPNDYSKRLEVRSINNYIPALYDVSNIGGGIRIKSIIDSSDGIAETNIKTYEYKNDIGSSSGILLSWPRYTINWTIPADNALEQNLAFIRSNPIGRHILDIPILTYSQVTENIEGNGKKVVRYTDFVSNSDDNNATNFFDNRGGATVTPKNLARNYMGYFLNDRSIERGKILWEKIYDNTNNLKEQTNYVYNSDITKINKWSAKLHLSGPSIQSNKLYYYQDYLTQKTTTSKLNTRDLVSTENYTYINGFQYNTSTNSQDVLFKSVSTTSIANENLETQYKYPWDIYSGIGLDNFKNNNIANSINQSQFRNSIKLSEQFTEYVKDASTNNLFLPKNMYAAKFPNNLPLISNIGNLEKKFTYDSYDDKGNVTQYSLANGISISIIWGYNKTLPIAKIENATYAQVQPHVANLQSLSNGNNEQNLITALNNLRIALPNAMISTYTHKPLIGVSSVTDSKGNIQTYHYDNFNRLQFVKDKDGNILSENEYHYKN